MKGDFWVRSFYNAVSHAMTSLSGFAPQFPQGEPENLRKLAEDILTRDERAVLCNYNVARRRNFAQQNESVSQWPLF